MAQKIKKTSYIVLSVLIVALLLSLCGYKQKNAEPLKKLKADQITAFEALDYEVSFDDKSGAVNFEKLVIESEEDEAASDKTESDAVTDEDSEEKEDEEEKISPYVYLDLPDTPLSFMTLELNEPLEKGDSVSVYYTVTEKGELVEKHTYASTLGGNDKTRLFVIFSDVVTDTESIRFESDSSFAIKGIELYNTEGYAYSLSFNFIAFITLAIILIALLIFERLFGYYSWVIGNIRSQFSFTRELSAESKLLSTLHVFAVISTVVFVAFCAISLIFEFFSRPSMLIAFILACVALVLQLADRLISKRNYEPAKLFLTVGVIVGVLICFTMPTSTHLAWDDEIHLRQAYSIVHLADGQISLAQWRLFNYNYVFSNFIEDPMLFTGTMLSEDTVMIDYRLPSVNVYNALGYLPMIASILFSALFNVNTVKMLAFCHFANLFTYIAIMYCGIRRLSRGGYIAAAIALLPSTLYLACSCNYDFWLTAWFTYCVAYVISVYQHKEQKFETADLVKLLVIMFIACGPKPVYCVMFLPLLFLSTSKFKSPKQAKAFRFATVATVVAIAAVLVIFAVFVNNLYSDSRGGSNVNGAEQIKYILTHPFNYAYTLLKQMGQYVSVRSFTDYSSAFGYLTSYGANPLYFFGSLSAILIMYCIFVDRNPDDMYGNKNTQRLRWMALLTCFLQIVIICTSMYIGYTDVGANYINGCQVRYLFPLLFPIFFFMTPVGVHSKISERMKSATVFSAITFNLLFGYFIYYIDRFIG